MTAIIPSPHSMLPGHCRQKRFVRSFPFHPPPCVLVPCHQSSFLLPLQACLPKTRVHQPFSKVCQHESTFGTVKSMFVCICTFLFKGGKDDNSLALIAACSARSAKACFCFRLLNLLISFLATSGAAGGGAVACLVGPACHEEV